MAKLNPVWSLKESRHIVYQHLPTVLHSVAPIAPELATSSASYLNMIPNAYAVNKHIRLDGVPHNSENSHTSEVEYEYKQHATSTREGEHLLSENLEC